MKERKNTWKGERERERWGRERIKQSSKAIPRKYEEIWTEKWRKYFIRVAFRRREVDDKEKENKKKRNTMEKERKRERKLEKETEKNKEDQVTKSRERQSKKIYI